MGYNTKFRGILTFTSFPTAAELTRLSAVFGEDRRDHPEWRVSDSFYYLDLQLSKDFSGIEWNEECEKTYGMHEMVEFIIRWMQEVKSNFGLHGTMFAEGEDWDDRWRLIVSGSDITTITAPPAGTPVTCPACENKFIPEVGP